MIRAAKILTVSDSVHAGIKEDGSGPLIVQYLEHAGFTIVDQRVVGDGVESVAAALREFAHDFSGLVVTTGGTGFSPRDLTPEASLLVFDREAPGLAEAMRMASPLGRLSRARAGTVGRCLILNTPGSSKGAIEYLEAVADVVVHALELLDGQSSQHPPETGGSTATSS
jgi:molybdopterin adenylyltransferase